MKCVALRRCQTHDSDGFIKTYAAGDVDDFEKCPTHFRPMEGAEAVPIDFETAQEQELLEADYDLDALKAYIEKKYDKKAGNRGKEKTVVLLLDCRYREINIDVNKVM